METGFKLKKGNPKEQANCISRLCFAWMIKLFYKGTQRGLEITDLYNVEDVNSSERLADNLEQNWKIELTKAKRTNRSPQLIRALLATFFWSYMMHGILLFIQHVGLRSYQPVVLSYLISLFKNPDEDHRNAMYLSATILVSISVIVIFCMHHAAYGQSIVGMRIRIAVSSLIYRKVLRLNRKSIGQTAIGQVVNLLSNDVNRFDLVVMALHYLWIMPFQITLITYLIWQQVGVSALAGVLAMALLTLPLQGYLGKLTSTLRLKVAERSDRRVTLMGEIISGIQVIKMYAWEKPFERVVQAARLAEICALIKTSYVRGIYLSSMVFVERATLFLTIICHVLLGNVILAEQVFSMAQFFSLLQLTMSIFYPLSISYGAEALVSISRIERFLLMNENDEESVVQKDFNYGVFLKDVQAAWEPTTITLHNLNIDIPSGSLCAIIGPVGAGKSSLLQLLLGELRPDFGTIKIEGNISYSAQEPWLFASTIRNSILFGEMYNKKLYKKVIKVCALQKDFEQLPFADKTMVGERGAALSGGQRARVNLARSIYRQADVYLLDDPLSAVDTHVGKHLFNECIIKHLKGKTRILVTHQLQHLKKADIILVMNQGRIEACGTFEELSKSNLNFAHILESSSNDNAERKPEPESPVEQKASFLLSHSLLLDSVALRSESLHNDEERHSSTSTKSFMQYVKASGNWCIISTLAVVLILGQAACSGADYWVTFWTQQEAIRNSNATSNLVPVTEKLPYFPYDFGNDYIYPKPVEHNNNELINTYTAIYIYSAFIVSAIIITLCRSFLYFKLAMNASKNLHNRIFSALLEAPMRFFNCNPSGRILNRFSKDMGAVDEILPMVLLESIQITLVMCGILVMVVISNVYMIVPILILGSVFLKLRSWFIMTGKDIKHMEGITKSPMFSHLNSSLQGITTIRAFGAEEMLRKEFDDHQDIHTSAWILTITCMVSFGLWLDILCVLFIASTTFGLIILNEYTPVNASLAGLAISQSLILTGMLQYGIRQSAEVINQLTSVERILQYTNLEKEGPFVTGYDGFPPKDWPTDGSLEMQNLSLRYSPDSPPTLKNLTITINAGDKIGIVGRTGAGKSSLISALFRLAIIEGNILIDGINTKLVGLNDLRRSISIIPQEPVLFSASLRYNLDPFDEFDDFKLWNVLVEVELKDIAKSLDVTVSGGGGNLSVGQRQLLCLARAILRNNKLLVLDEATANIDQKTDALIQETIRKKFKSCTVLTIAHRLDTIMDSDKIIVMENGCIVEYDYPYKLLQRPDTFFYKMVLDTGLSMSEHLEHVALDAFLKIKD